MEKDFVRYLKHHTIRVTAVVILVFILLAAGEYYLYRQMFQLKGMVSEGMMQLKEGMTQRQAAPEPSPSTKMMNGQKNMMR